MKYYLMAGAVVLAGIIATILAHQPESDVQLRTPARETLEPTTK